MRRPFSFLALCQVASVLPSVCFSCPGAEPITDVPAPLLIELTDWIARNTDYDVSVTLASPPAIRACSIGETISYEGVETVVAADLRGAYSLTDRTIFLVSPWSPDNIADRARLLHELVHDVQFQTARWRCAQAAETEAYRLTATWLEAQGMVPHFNWFEIYLLSRCPSDIHP